MIDAKKLMEQFLGSGAAGTAATMAQQAKDRFLPQGAQLPGGAAGGMLGGLAAGGLLGVLMGSKKVRKMAGGVIGYGGSAALGALALHAWQTWQASQSGQPAPAQASAPAQPAQLQRLGADGKPFELALVRAMIAAANADGHIGASEHAAIFEAINRLALDPEAKAFVFDAIARPPSALEVAALASGPEQASEIWLASRLAIDPDDPREREYLNTLAGALNIAAGLAEQLEREIRMQQESAT